MRIGELAKRADVTPHTIRYYEREGLLPAPERTSSGYRDYGTNALDDLLFIRKAQALGLKLSDVREVLTVASGGQSPCDHVRATLTARLADVDVRLGQLRQLRSTLEDALKRFERTTSTEPGCRCAVIEAAN